MGGRMLNSFKNAKLSRWSRFAVSAAAALVLVAAAGGCQPQPAEETPEQQLAALDSILSELGGDVTAGMSRGQRWRMISSVGAGLPPTDFQAEDLPEANSRGAGLIQVYCVQCHWIPVPQMHTAAEWPILVRRMLLRARTLDDRMGGPMTESLLGEFLMAGISNVEVPTQDQVDTMTAYLRRNALQAATQSELGEGEDARFYVQHCSICHETPSPTIYTSAEWATVITRMQSNMAAVNLKPFDAETVSRILSYLRERSSR